jgi:hypothetical protein
LCPILQLLWYCSCCLLLLPSLPVFADAQMCFHLLLVNVLGWLG